MCRAITRAPPPKLTSCISQHKNSYFGSRQPGINQRPCIHQTKPGLVPYQPNPRGFAIHQTVSQSRQNKNTMDPGPQGNTRERESGQGSQESGRRSTSQPKRQHQNSKTEAAYQQV